MGMNAEQPINEQDSLQIISQMIQQARNKLTENGHLYLLWGWSILVVTVVHFVLSFYVPYQQATRVWALTLLPWVYMMVYQQRRQQKATVKSYTDELSAFIWIAFAVLMLLMGFILGRQQDYGAMYPMALVAYGMPTFLSGKLLRFNPLIWGGIACWAFAIPCLYTPIPYQVLWISLAVIVAWLVPGYALQHRFYKQQQTA